MTVTLDLSPEQEARLQAQAQTQGKPLEVYLREAIDRLAPPTLTTKQKAAIALLELVAARGCNRRRGGTRPP